MADSTSPMDRFSALLAHNICLKLFGDISGGFQIKSKPKQEKKHGPRNNISFPNSHNIPTSVTRSKTSSRPEPLTRSKTPSRPELQWDNDDDMYYDYERHQNKHQSKINLVSRIDISHRLRELFAAFSYLDERIVLDIIAHHKNELSAFDVIHSIVLSGIQEMGFESQSFPPLSNQELNEVVESCSVGESNSWEVLSLCSENSDWSMLSEFQPESADEDYVVVSSDGRESSFPENLETSNIPQKSEKTEPEKGTSYADMVKRIQGEPVQKGNPRLGTKQRFSSANQSSNARQRSFSMEFEDLYENQKCVGKKKLKDKTLKPRRKK